MRRINSYYWLRDPTNNYFIPNGYKSIKEYEEETNMYHTLSNLCYFNEVLKPIENRITEPPRNNEPYFFIIHSHNWLKMKNKQPFIPQSVVHKLDHDPNFFLVFLEPTELHERNFSSDQDERIDSIRNLMQNLTIPKHKKYVVTANINAEKEPKDREWYWEWGYNLFNYWHGNAEAKYNDVVVTEERNFKFLFLGGRLRDHRILTLYHLREYLNQINASLHWCGDASDIEGLQGYKHEWRQDLTSVSQWARDNLPLKIDIPGDTMDSNRIIMLGMPSDIFSDAWFQIVPETQFNTIHHDDNLFITEKSMRPFAVGQPAIWLARRGAVKYLQDLGYETFPDIFDESYDDIVDDKERFECVMDQIKYWVNKDEKAIHQTYMSVIERLKRNQQHCYNNFNNVQLQKSVLQLFSNIADNDKREL